MAQTFEQLWSLVQPPTEHTPTYRLYYDNQGYLLFYSMDDLPGQWVAINAEQFAKADSHVKVVDGTVVPLNRIQSKKLVPSDCGTTCATASVAIVLPESETGQKWCLKTYETD